MAEMVQRKRACDQRHLLRDFFDAGFNSAERSINDALLTGFSRSLERTNQRITPSKARSNAASNIMTSLLALRRVRHYPWHRPVGNEGSHQYPATTNLLLS